MWVRPVGWFADSQSMGKPKKKNAARPGRSGNPARRAAAAATPRQTAHSTQHIDDEPRRVPRQQAGVPTTVVGRRQRGVAAAVVTVLTAAVAVSLFAVASPPAVETEAGEALPTLVQQGPADAARTRAWAQLVYTSQEFQERLVIADTDAPARLRDTKPVARVARSLGFASPFATLAEYDTQATERRFCLRTTNGEYLARTESLESETAGQYTMSLGVGKCDYTDGTIYTSTSGIERGEDDLTRMQPVYEQIVAAATPGPVG
jgi:hypothetical protein